MLNTAQIFYGDGSVVSFGSGIPVRDVQAIVQEDCEVGAEIVTGYDYYVLDDGRWRGVDIFGLFDFLMETGSILFGRTINREEYYKILKRVGDCKNGWLRHERRV